MPLMITVVEASGAPVRARVFNRMGNSRYRLRIDRGVPSVDATRYEVGCAWLLASGHVLVNARFLGPKAGRLVCDTNNAALARRAGPKLALCVIFSENRLPPRISPGKAVSESCPHVIVVGRR